MKTTNDKNGLQKLVERCKSETPTFFKRMRLIGLSLAAAGGVLIAAPVALPAAVITIGGYLIVAGSVATAVSQTAVTNDDSKPKK